MRRVLIVSLGVLALAGCGRKDEQQAQKPQPEDSAFTAEPAQQQGQAQPAADAAAASCTDLPSRDAIAKGIKDALAQIYGPDSAGTKVAVTALTPDSGCKTVTVAYKASGTAATAPMARDGGTWRVTLYNKPYPIP